MRIALVLDPLAKLKPWKDSSVAMMRAARRRGHTCIALLPESLRAHSEGGQVTVWAEGHVLQVHDEDAHWYDAGARECWPLHAFDAVIQRKDPPFDAEYLYATHLLEMAVRSGARVFNHPRALRDYNEKLAILRFADWTTPTCVSRESARLREFVREHGDVILKPLDGMGGSSIFRVSLQDPNLSVILETITRHDQETVMAQRYIPEIVHGDKRILLINGEPLPYALARIPMAGETRGNLAAGGRGVAQALTERDRQIAEAVGPQLRADGLLLVGLDVIGDYLTEVNVTSPTCMVEIAAQTDCQPAELFLDALEQACGH
ncbi:glutathione synthase [Leeia aquatica]|uniref:Glutathione synthetase n=1 Tax=Leeia aquatica TaxID=2725557 RepID=A0A847SKK0_9NEIS|nr:glutathione synthase [Leeia aquatica]NLR76452.1 glutathione synthase [Leeia aquatica]